MKTFLQCGKLQEVDLIGRHLGSFLGVGGEGGVGIQQKLQLNKKKMFIAAANNKKQ